MAKKDELNFETDNKMASSEKLKALQAAMEKIEKSFGKGSIMKMGDDSVEQVEVIPTGSIALNVALGVGGYPRGRIIEIYGPESSGKTTLAIHAIAEAQKAGGIAAFIDAEHAFDRFYKARNEHNKNGSGLGLAIAKQIAQRHDMQLQLQSKLGEGTTIIITLPPELKEKEYADE